MKMCPKCKTEMAREMIGAIEVDKCVNCGGIWFDTNELKMVLDIYNTSRIDKNENLLSLENNTKRIINCPVDGSQMVAFENLKSDRVSYESCPACSGTYLDSGELEELEKNHLVELIQEILIYQKNRI